MIWHIGRIWRALALAPALLALAGWGAAAAGSTVEVEFDADDFPPAVDVSNPWLGLGNEPPTRVYRAVTLDECEFSKQTIGYTLHPPIAGVDVLVVRDQEWVTEAEDGECDPGTAELEEDTQDYYAQDLDGNVWYLGEDTWAPPDEEEGGETCSDEGAWIAGEDEAEPGIIMLADPASGLRYRQEYLEDEAEDWGGVLRLNGKVEIEFGAGEIYADCLVTREWTPLEPGEVEKKWYCMAQSAFPGGLALVEELKAKTLRVEYIGAFLPALFPGENEAFPAVEALDCELPE